MKRLLHILLLLTMLAACSREVETAPLYRQYASRPDLTVAQVTGFQLGDTVRVDVVILVADDSAAWQGLKTEFDIRPSEGVTSWLGDIDNPARRVKRSEVPGARGAHPGLLPRGDTGRVRRLARIPDGDYGGLGVRFMV